MESARPNPLRSVVIIAVAFLVGYLVANPAGTVWRAKYWMGFGDRAGALDKLVIAESDGAESELTHAIEADDAALRLRAAEALAARGDKRGIETLVALCGDGTASGTAPRKSLESLLDDPSRLEDYDSVRAWYDSMRHVLQCSQHAVWREKGQ